MYNELLPTQESIAELLDSVRPMKSKLIKYGLSRYRSEILKSMNLPQRELFIDFLKRSLIIDETIIHVQDINKDLVLSVVFPFFKNEIELIIPDYKKIGINVHFKSSVKELKEVIKYCNERFFFNIV